VVVVGGNLVYWLGGSSREGYVFFFFYVLTPTPNLVADTLRPLPLPQLLVYRRVWPSATQNGHTCVTVSNYDSRVLLGLLDREDKGAMIL
jgi:hypothetical protein